MKFAIVFAAVLAVAVALPANDKESTVLRYDSDVQPDGYNFA